MGRFLSKEAWKRIRGEDVPAVIPDHDIILALCKYLKVNIHLKDRTIINISSDQVEIYPQQEDEPTKELEPSCLSCRFHAGRGDNVTIHCKNEEVNRCFLDSIFIYSNEAQMRSFSCSFYEFNLDFDERFGKKINMAEL